MTKKQKRLHSSLHKKLSNRNGVVKTPRIDKAIKKWWETKNQLVIEHNDEVLGALINRMAVIGHRCGLLFHLITGKKVETPTSVKFALLMAEYVLGGQLKFFGTTLQKLAERQTAVKMASYSPNKKMLCKLPNVFCFEDVKALKIAENADIQDGSIQKMIKRWSLEGLVDSIGKNQFRKL